MGLGAEGFSWRGLHEAGSCLKPVLWCWRSGCWCSFGSISSAFLFLWLSGAHRTGASAFVVLEAPSFSSAMREIVAGELPKLVFLRMSSYRSPAASCPAGELRGGAGRQLGRVGGRGVGKGEKCPWGWLVLEEVKQGTPGSAACSVLSTCCTVVRGVGRVLRAGRGCLAPGRAPHHPVPAAVSETVCLASVRSA